MLATGDDKQNVQLIHHPAKNYVCFKTFVRSRVTGQKALLAVAKSKPLPEEAFTLMLGQSAGELQERRAFFFPEDRYFKDDKLANDLGLSVQLGFIPVYSDRLPQTDAVEVFRGGQTELAMPVLPATIAAETQTQVAAVKRKLIRLLSLKDQEAVAALTELAGKLDELRASSGASECIRMTAYLLRFPVHGTMQAHLALVRHVK